MTKLEKYNVKIKLPEIKVNLSDTIDFFKQIENKKEGIIKSKWEPINDLEIEFHYNVDKWVYLTKPLKKYDSSCQHIGSGLLDKFDIVTKSSLYNLKNGVSKCSLKISNLTNKGEIREIEQNYSEDKSFFRLAMPIDGYTKVPNKYFWTNSFKIGDSIRAAGYLEIKIDDINLGLFDYKIENKRFIFIDCHKEIKKEKFEKLAETILYSYAFISGCLINTTYNYLKFQNSNFTKLVGFKVKRVEKSIITNYELFNTREFKTYFNTKSLYFFPKKIVSNLSNSCYTNPRFLRALRILCNARQKPVEIEASSIFVVLETIKDLILINKTEKVSPFKDDEFAKKIIKEFKQEIESLDDSNFNRKNSVLNKIQDLNKPGNNESFRLAFEMVGFELSKNDKKCIAMRNRFLHGNMPYDNEVQEERQKQLAKISLSAHFLTCCLILKYIGFDGYVKNFLKFLDITNEIDEIDEKLFRKI
ncbi:hypothetical protein [Winogradskyella sp. PC D3.3]